LKELEFEAVRIALELTARRRRTAEPSVGPYHSALCCGLQWRDVKVTITKAGPGSALSATTESELI
jgi:hypothetical protein